MKIKIGYTRPITYGSTGSGSRKLVKMLIHFQHHLHLSWQVVFGSELPRPCYPLHKERHPHGSVGQHQVQNFMRNKSELLDHLFIKKLVINYKYIFCILPFSRLELKFLQASSQRND
jgi:hypothetical protein